MKILIITASMAALLPIAFAQNAQPAKNAEPAQGAAPARVEPADAKNHIGENATVCGKVVDTNIMGNGLLGHGMPVILDLDQPEPNPVFYFVAFGNEDSGPQEIVDAYKGKQVCVTGKISSRADVPFIMAAKRTSIKVQMKSK